MTMVSFSATAARHSGLSIPNSMNQRLRNPNSCHWFIMMANQSALQRKNRPHPKNRQEQKDHMCDCSDDDITNPDGCNSQGDAAEVEQPTPNPDKKQKEKNGENTRTDYSKKEWHAFETILQNGDVEVSNNLCEQMMKHIKMNLKNCLNIGSEDSALDYAFMFSAIESCDINRLSPECYLRKLILGLHEVSKKYKVVVEDNTNGSPSQNTKYITN